MSSRMLDDVELQVKGVLLCTRRQHFFCQTEPELRTVICPSLTHNKFHFRLSHLECNYVILYHMMHPNETSLQRVSDFFICKSLDQIIRNEEKIF